MHNKYFVPSDKMLLGFVLAMLTFWLFSLSLNSVVDKLIADPTLNIPSAQIALGITITALFSGCFIVVAGGIGDKIGQLKITYTGLALTIIGSLLLIFATNAFMFITARILQGLSAACIMSSTLAQIKMYYDGTARQRALSFWSIGSWGGAGFCTFFGDLVSKNYGWRTIFMISIVVAIISVLLLFGTPATKNASPDSKAKFDRSGLCFFLITLISLNLFITNGRSLGWFSPYILIALAITVVGFIVFYLVEKRKQDAAFIDFALFKSGAFNGANLSNFLANCTVGVLSIVPLYIRDGLKFEHYGWLTLGYAVSVLAMIRVGELILRKVGAKKPMMLGVSITGIGIVLMALTFLPSQTYFISVAIGFLLFGLGLGFYATPSTDTAVSNSPSEKAGVASGIYKMASSLGSAFGVAITLSVYYSVLPDNPTLANVAQTASISLFVNAGFCLLSVLSVFFLVPKMAGKK
ncbi:MFS transporter [Neisseria sp. Ec49-e6-T10]|uniref:MFS transporter n=1 Tax=Neisseria sp. Ec49-e6-T10 TaxID=3140744 RepID=UPI003EB8293B